MTGRCLLFITFTLFCVVLLASAAFGQETSSVPQSSPPSTVQGSSTITNTPVVPPAQQQSQQQAQQQAQQQSQQHVQQQTQQQGPQQEQQKSYEKKKKKSTEAKTEQGGSIQDQIDELRQQIDKLRKEAEARKKLEITEEEKSEKEKDILNAAGRQYTMMQKDTLALVLSAGYAYYISETVANNQFVYYANHNITTAMEVDYAWRNNLTSSFSIPFKYAWDRQGTTTSLTATDLGDVSMGVSWQPIKSGEGLPSMIFSGSLVFPTGKSPYDIVPGQALSTGNGYYGMSLGLSASLPIDPLAVFGAISYGHSLPVSGIKQNWSIGELQKVTPGDSIGVSLGLGEALNYMVSASIGWSYSYSFSTQYQFSGGFITDTGTSFGSSITLGTSWKISPTRSFNLSFAWGLTAYDPTVGISLTVPFEFPIGR